MTAHVSTNAGIVFHEKIKDPFGAQVFVKVNCTDVMKVFIN
jgi:hypothetical protein